MVSYTNEVKHGVLGVPQALLDQYGAVSGPVARAMAEGARRALGCDLALSTTGVAGPDRDDRGNEVGTMFVAIAAPDGTHVRPLHLGGRPVRGRLRTQTAHHALDLARRWLTGLPPGGTDGGPLRRMPVIKSGAGEKYPPTPCNPPRAVI